MSLATKKLTLDEWITYTDGTDTRYELVHGSLMPMSLGTGKHGSIIRYLAQQFEAEAERLNRPWIAIQGMVGIQSPGGGRWDTGRIPDLAILPSAAWQEMADREAIIRLSDPPPVLVVEVVSHSTKSDDYGAKWSEYSVLNIPEYWIADPIDHLVTVAELINGRYQDALFRGDDRIISSIFPDLNLTAAQVIKAGS
ncbi:Uma2 family endonuclease [Kovacikia minuta CCNUW1]|uniref:Uma2 family endonuclease n=1 Tax=Kovacikia minuta TaxID=2931930 RepID=UPI001CC9A55F|nr:Uma2 family endonuclease [Kovacikia minuta]UBF23857.1 Uma2 family endonuclease [Kovacikia minuta CCNUW1]